MYEKIEEKGKTIWLPLSEEPGKLSGNAIPVPKRPRTKRKTEPTREPLRAYKHRKNWY